MPKRFEVLALACMALSFIGSGCATAPRPDIPTRWPATWDGRRVFNTEHAIIYARHEAAVDEVEKLTASLAKEFTRRTGGQPTRGLIIVNDVEDSSIGDLPLDTMQPSALIPQEIRNLEVPNREKILASPIELSPEHVSGPMASSQEAAWAVALPSRKRLQACANQMLDGTLANPQLGALERALITGFKPMFADCIVDTVGGTRETMIYKQFCDTQTAWDPSRRQSEFEKFSPPPVSTEGLPPIPRSPS